MSTEVAIALITSIASLFVAAVSLISAIISNRQSARSAAALETLKNRFAKEESTHKVRDEYLTKSIESLGCLIQDIQHMKDVVQLVLTAPDGSMDSESTLKMIADTREHIFSCYEKELPSLDEDAAKAAHRAKNCALSIDRLLQTALEDTEYVTEMDGEDYQGLQELRDILTDMQNLLRDSRTTALLRRTEPV